MILILHHLHTQTNIQGCRIYLPVTNLFGDIESGCMRYYTSFSKGWGHKGSKSRSLLFLHYDYILHRYYYVLQSGAMDYQINHNSIRKNVYCSKLIFLQRFYCLEWSILLTLGRGVLIWLLTNLMTSLSQCVNELINSFIT